MAGPMFMRDDDLQAPRCTLPEDGFTICVTPQPQKQLCPMREDDEADDDRCKWFRRLPVDLRRRLVPTISRQQVIGAALTLVLIAAVVVGYMSREFLTTPTLTPRSAAESTILAVETPFSASQPGLSRVASDPFLLRMMTFNLRYAPAHDGMNSWSNRRTHAADLINRFAPAILGTQEGVEDQLADLQRLLSRPYERFGQPREHNGEHVQIFYDRTVVERVDGGTFWLSETPTVPGSRGWDANNPRIATWCRFRLLATQQQFVFVNTHLDSYGAVARLEGAKVIWDQLRSRLGEELEGDDALPLFLAGDFNTFRRTDVYEFLTTSPTGPAFTDAWITAEHRIGNVSCTFHEFVGPAFDETTHPDWIPPEIDAPRVMGGNHIDWILTRPKLPVLVTEVLTESRRGRYPSDHYPVTTTVLLPSRMP